MSTRPLCSNQYLSEERRAISGWPDASDLIVGLCAARRQWQIHAPPARGIYDYQWQMVHENVCWLGQMSRNQPIGVGPPVKLVRDNQGRILDNVNGNPLTLKGGHYYLFQQDGAGPKGIFHTNTANLYTVSYGNEISCKDRKICGAEAQAWQGGSDLWGSV
jgi:hypothetical protein